MHANAGRIASHSQPKTSVSDSIEFTPSIVFSKVMNLQSGKSPGPDGWPIEIIKLVGESVSLPLSIMFTTVVFYRMTGNLLM